MIDFVKINLLIVEDEKISALFLQDMLEKMNYRICGTAAGAEEAMTLFYDQKPDMVLMDINLEGHYDGIDLAVRMQESRHVPVIYLTANHNEAIKERLKNTVYYGFILKPYNIEYINFMIDSAWDRFLQKQALVESENRFRTIFETIPVSLMLVDPGSRMVRDYNREFETLTGYVKTDRQQLNLQDLLPDLPLTDDHQGRVVLNLSDGRRIPVFCKRLSVTISHIEMDMMALIDLTYIETTERKLETGNRQLDLKVRELDALFLISRMLGREDMSIPDLLKTVVDLIPEAFPDTVKVASRVLYDNRIYESNKRIIGGRITSIPLHVLGTRAGSVEAFIKHKKSDFKSEGLDEDKVLLSITTMLSRSIERIKTSELLIKEEKMSAIGKLAAGVAHDLNTPLAFIMQNISTLEKYCRLHSQMFRDLREGNEGAEFFKKYDYDYGFITQDIQDIFDESAEGLDRIKSLTENLKQLSRMDSTEDAADCQINDIIRSSFILARNEIKYCAEVRADYGDIPEIRGRKNELGQVFLNIIVNAAYSIKSRGSLEAGTISVRTYSDESYVYGVISDTGRGMDEKTRENIFKSFFTTKGQEGTGLGMYISWDIIVNRHKGHIDVKSQPDKGCTITISLPLSGEADIKTL